MQLKVQIITNALIRIGQSIHGFVEELKTTAESAQVEAIAAEFPGGTEVDQACITLCNDALAVINSIDKKLPNVAIAIDAIYTNLKVQIAQLKHNNPSHGLGFYIKLIGLVIEDAAASIKV